MCLTDDLGVRAFLDIASHLVTQADSYCLLGVQAAVPEACTLNPDHGASHGGAHTWGDVSHLEGDIKCGHSGDVGITLVRHFHQHLMLAMLVGGQGAGDLGVAPGEEGAGRRAYRHLSPLRPQG